MKDDKVYEQIKRLCEVCNRRTYHVIESLVTVCTECDTKTDDDAEELFGAIE